jgi:hypothetical protein
MSRAFFAIIVRLIWGSVLLDIGATETFVFLCRPSALAAASPGHADRDRQSLRLYLVRRHGGGKPRERGGNERVSICWVLHIISYTQGGNQ